MFPIKKLTSDYDRRGSFLRPQQKVENFRLNNQESACRKKGVQIEQNSSL